MNDLINYLSAKKIIIVCGHYGTGKTNIAVNLAVKLKEQTGYVYTLVDLDIVNPYFRSADNVKDLQKLGIDCIIPQFANTNVDIPAVPSAIYSIFANKSNITNKSKSNERRAVIDVGGDDNGAAVLGMFADKIKTSDYEMIYVVNKYRIMISDYENAAELAELIEDKSKLKITSVINNSNIGSLTTEREILNSADYANKISGKLNVPMIAATAFIQSPHTVQINNYTKKLF
jgi:DNA helicase HerA-like ATPase